MNADRSARSPHLRSSPRIAREDGRKRPDERGPIRRVLSMWHDRTYSLARRVWVPAFSGPPFCLGLAIVSSLPARAADTIQIGSVDATSANLWPLYVAQSKGYFDAADLKLDVVFSQSNAQVIQQL